MAVFFDRLRMDRYVVIGNPVAHSLSPAIHAAFARQTGQAIEYARMQVEDGDFRVRVRAFFDGGGRGASVTLPFKGDAFEFADAASERARLARAANFLMLRGGGIFADNTDGAGLVADLTRNHGFELKGAQVLIVGAGGAARGVIGPMLARAPARVVVANRTLERAQVLAASFGALGEIEAVALDSIPAAPVDLVLNATSASTLGASLSPPEGIFGRSTLAYDMAYGMPARAFVEGARALGARATDGLGMLVEQAAEAFELWRGIRPATQPVLEQLGTPRA